MLRASRTSLQPFARTAVAAAALACGWASAAESAQPLPELQEVIVESASSTAGFQAKEVELGPLGTRAVLDTPYSVRTVSREMIENQQATSVHELLKYLPSAQMQARGGADVGRPQTRGMQSSVVANNHLDGLNVVGTTAYPMELYERIEVIQSLSGAFYGPASPAGNFNFIQKRPALASQKRLTAGYSSSRVYGAHADLSGPLDVNKVATYRTNLLHEEGEGYVQGSTQRRSLVGLALDVRPNASTVIELNASRYHFVRKGFPGSFAYATGLLPAAPDPTRVGYGQSYAGLDLETSVLNARVLHRINDDWRVTAGVLRQIADRSLTWPTNTMTGTSGGYTTTVGSSAAGRFVVDSNLLQLSGRVRQGGWTHDLVVGTTGFNWDVFSYPNKTYTLGQASIGNPAVFAEPQWADPGSRYHAIRNAQQSLVLGDSVDFGGGWSAVLGASWSQMRARTYNAAGAQTSADDKTGWSSTAALVYKPQADTSLYASWADSLEQADAAPNGAANQGATLSPFRSQQWELGAKRSLGRLDVSAALFRINRPFAFTDPSDNYFKVHGDQSNTGLELAASGAFWPRWHVFGGVTLLDPKLKNTGKAATSNKQVVGVPKVQANLLLEYQPRSVQGLVLSSNLHHTGRRAADDSNAQWISGYTTLDVGARYSTRVSGVATTWRLSVNNVFDKRYWLSIFPGSVNGNGASSSAFLGSPRELRLSVAVDL
jgi:iron complex outermembrane receptor protein